MNNTLVPKLETKRYVCHKCKEHSYIEPCVADAVTVCVLCSTCKQDTIFYKIRN